MITGAPPGTRTPNPRITDLHGLGCEPGPLWVLLDYRFRGGYPVIAGVMRYADGGGVNEAGRARREQVRRAAAAMFANGTSAPQVAAVLEVSTKAAYQWRRTWA